MTSVRRLAVLAVPLCLLAGGAAAQRPEMLTTATELRICADPSNLPFSNQTQDGFENKIAAVLAADLQVPLSYVWFPQTTGFVRNTIGARRCDLVMGTVAGDPSLDTTDPYYRTGYMIVTREADGLLAAALDDSVFAGKRFGLIAATPPTDYLLKHDLLGHTTSYSLAADTRYANPSAAMLKDLADGKIDVGLLWGPIAGYAITHDHMKLRAVQMQAEPGLPRLDFQIAMGVRPNEPEWRRKINAAIGRHRGEITAILTEYGVPLLDAHNQPVAAVQ